MLVNKLKLGTIFYCIPVSTSGETPYTMEIYEFKGIHPTTKNVLYNIILGERFTCRFPDCDLDEGFYGYYSRNSIWFFTTNDNLAIEVYKHFLDNDYREIHLVYDIWNNVWRNVDIYLGEKDDNEREF